MVSSPQQSAPARDQQPMQFWGDVSDRLTLVAILRQLPGATAKQVGNRWSIYIPKKEGR